MKKILYILLSAVLIVAAALFTACDKGETDSESSSPASYEVTFKNYDGAVLYTTSVNKGKTPVYAGETPKRASENGVEYTFSGWAEKAGGKALSSLARGHGRRKLLRRVHERQENV